MPRHLLRPFPAEILTLGGRQRGRVMRTQLLRAGVPGSTIDDWLGSGRLVVEHPGVYRLAGAALSWEADAHAGQLYFETSPVGPAVLVGAGAGHVHGLLGCTGRPRPIPLLTPRRSRAVLDGIRLGWDLSIDRTEWCSIDGLRVTGVPRTLVDLAVRPPRPIGDILTDAWSRRLLDDLDDVATEVAAARRPGGLPRHRRILARLDELAVALEHLAGLDGRPRSGTEVTAGGIAVAAGYPRPALNAPVSCCGRTWLLDLFWEQYLVNVEVDGPHHRWPTQQARDRERDRHLSEHRGITVVRVPVDVVDRDPSELVARLAAVWPAA